MTNVPSVVFFSSFFFLATKAYPTSFLSHFLLKNLIMQILFFSIYFMPPFHSDAFIINVDNHVSWCMDSNINHFTNVRWPKSVTFTKGIADGLAIKTFRMVHWNLQDNQGCFHHNATHDAAWVLDLPHLLHGSKQANNHFPHPHGMCMQQLNNYTGSQLQYPLFFLWQRIQNKYKHQTIIEHFIFTSIVLSLDGDNNDSPPLPMPSCPVLMSN